MELNNPLPFQKESSMLAMDDNHSLRCVYFLCNGILVNDMLADVQMSHVNSCHVMPLLALPLA